MWIEQHSGEEIISSFACILLFPKHSVLEFSSTHKSFIFRGDLVVFRKDYCENSSWILIVRLSSINNPDRGFLSVWL